MTSPSKSKQWMWTVVLLALAAGLITVLVLFPVVAKYAAFVAVLFLVAVFMLAVDPISPFHK